MSSVDAPIPPADADLSAPGASRFDLSPRKFGTLSRLHKTGGNVAGPLWRRSELVILAYFAYATVVAYCLPLADAIRLRTAGVNISLFTVYLLLALGESRYPQRWITVARDWLPLALVLLAYREMGWFAPAQHTNELEQGWIVWDRLLLNDWGLRSAIEAGGPLIPAALEICYALVYLISPAAMAILHALGETRQTDRFLLLYLLGSLGSYALFPYFPSEPPRTLFAGEEVPGIDSVFRHFNWWILGHGGIHTSVFPSGHVSSAFALAISLLRVLPKRRWIGAAFLIVAAGIFVGTIYGRYHYAVDALAGLGVSFAAWLAVAVVERRCGTTH